jgi:hypothetical protein
VDRRHRERCVRRAGRRAAESGRLQPGRYRIEVVNFAAPPGTKVDLRLTFFDSAGQPGA